MCTAHEAALLLNPSRDILALVHTPAETMPAELRGGTEALAWFEASMRCCWQPSRTPQRPGSTITWIRSPGAWQTILIAGDTGTNGRQRNVLR